MILNTYSHSDIHLPNQIINIHHLPNFLMCPFKEFLVAKAFNIRSMLLTTFKRTIHAAQLL